MFGGKPRVVSTRRLAEGTRKQTEKNQTKGKETINVSRYPRVFQKPVCGLNVFVQLS